MESSISSQNAQIHGDAVRQIPGQGLNFNFIDAGHEHTALLLDRRCRSDELDGHLCPDDDVHGYLEEVHVQHRSGDRITLHIADDHLVGVSTHVEIDQSRAGDAGHDFGRLARIKAQGDGLDPGPVQDRRQLSLPPDLLHVLAQLIPGAGFKNVRFQNSCLRCPCLSPSGFDFLCRRRRLLLPAQQPGSKQEGPKDRAGRQADHQGTARVKQGIGGAIHAPGDQEDCVAAFAKLGPAGQGETGA